MVQHASDMTLTNNATSNFSNFPMPDPTFPTSQQFQIQLFQLPNARSNFSHFPMTGPTFHTFQIQIQLFPLPNARSNFSDFSIPVSESPRIIGTGWLEFGLSAGKGQIMFP